MRRKLLAISAMVLSFGLVKAQPIVPEVQKSFYGVVEATWCGICGQHGIPTTGEVINQVGEKAIFFTMHAAPSSALYSPTAESFGTAFMASGQPYWTVNGTGLGRYSETIQTTVIDAINTKYDASSAEVNAGFDWYIKDDTIYVETLTKFFGSDTGEFYVGVYLSEDSIWEYQANYDPEIPAGNIFHNHILRTGFSSNAFGTEFSTGPVEMGAEFTTMHKLKIDPAWNIDNVHLYTAVWKKSGESYEFQNANDHGREIVITSTDQETSTTHFDIYPNPANNQLTISLDATIDDSYTVRILNSLGQIVQELNPGNNNQKINLNLSKLDQGVYFVNVSNGQNNQTLKFTKQ